MNRTTLIIAALAAVVCVNEATEPAETVTAVAAAPQREQEEPVNQPQPELAPSGPAADEGGGYVPVVEAEQQYAELFRMCGAQHGIDPALLAAVAKVESSYRNDASAVSHKGAQGLMQFMPKTAAAMGVDPWDPASAICGTAKYLRKSIGIHGDWDEAIAAYNAGDPAVTRKGASAADGTYVADVKAEWAARRK